MLGVLGARIGLFVALLDSSDSIRRTSGGHT